MAVKMKTFFSFTFPSSRSHAWARNYFYKLLIALLWPWIKLNIVAWISDIPSVEYSSQQ